MDVMKNSIVSFIDNGDVSKFWPRCWIALAVCAGRVKFLQHFLDSNLYRTYRVCWTVRCSEKFSLGIQQGIPFRYVE